MIQVNRVCRIGREASRWSGKFRCCTVANAIKLERIRTELMPTAVVVADFQGDRFRLRAAILHRAGHKGTLRIAFDTRIENLDRLGL